MKTASKVPFILSKWTETSITLSMDVKIVFRAQGSVNPRRTNKHSRKCKTSTSVKNPASSVAKFRSQAKRGTASPFTTPGPHRSSKSKPKITPKHQYLKKRSGVKGKPKDGKVRRMSWKERSLRKHKNPNLARSHKKLNEAEKNAHQILSMMFHHTTRRIESTLKHQYLSSGSLLEWHLLAQQTT